MDKRRVIHKEYGAGTAVDYAFIGMVSVTLVLFDSTNEEMLVPDDELEPEIKKPEVSRDPYIRTAEKRNLEKIRADALAEVEEIEEMNNPALVEEFQFLIRGGAGPCHRRVVFIRREIIRRMDRSTEEKEEGKDGI